MSILSFRGWHVIDNMYPRATKKNKVLELFFLILSIYIYNLFLFIFF